MNRIAHSARLLSLTLAVLAVAGTLQLVDTLASRLQGDTLMTRAVNHMTHVAKVTVHGVSSTTKRG